MKRRKHKDKQKQPVLPTCNVCGVSTQDINDKWIQISRELGAELDAHPDSGKLESAIDEGCCLACDAAMNERHRKEYKKKFRMNGKPRSPSAAAEAGRS